MANLQTNLYLGSLLNSRSTYFFPCKLQHMAFQTAKNSWFLIKMSSVKHFFGIPVNIVYTQK